RICATLGVPDTRVRYVVGNSGRLRRRGASLQLGFPVFGDNYTRLFLSYGIDQQSFTGSDPTASAAFRCNDCVHSTIGASLMRDTRIDLPFPTAGTMVQLGLSQSGGLLGGSGNFQRADLEGHFYAPIGTLGSAPTSNVKFVLGLSTRSGFVFGSSPFFEQLFTLGGTQFFIPLRGYDEGSITPFGYDPNAGAQINPNAFGQA